MFAPIDVDTATDSYRDDVVVATFARVHDATHAAVALSTADPRGELRIAIDLARPGEGRVPVLRLLDVGTAAVVVSGRLAPAAGLTLPAGSALVAQCDSPDGRTTASPPAYEVHIARPGGPAGGPTDSSNLAWAHRVAEACAPPRSTELDAAWRGALSDGPRLAVVTSPVGRAATTAAAGLALRAHATGALVLRGAWDASPRRPGGAWREALSHHAAVRGPREAAPALACHTRTTLDHSHTGPPVPAVSRVDGSFGEALVDWLRACSRRQPVLTVLDHAEWTDEWSRALWIDVAEELADERVLLAMVGARGVDRNVTSLQRTIAAARALDPRVGVIALDDR